MDRVRDSGVFKIGYRTDAAPYSYKNTLGEAMNVDSTSDCVIA